MPLLALVAGGCGADIFHSTDWETLCERDATAPPCVGDGGAGGGADADACTPCFEAASAAAPPPPALCASSGDIYALLQDCRCGMTSACFKACEQTPACGGVSDVSIDACDTCAKESCGELVESCAALTDR